jgi:6-phosphogluconolactonase
MSTLRHPASLPLIILTSLAFFLLSGCGTTHLVCGTCGCGTACPATQYMFADGNGQISAFVVPLSGTLGAQVSTSGPGGSLGMAAFENQFVYASNPNLPSMLGGNIEGWLFDASNGQLTALSGSPFALPMSVPGGLAANNSAQVLYVADAGRIDALQVNSMGALTALANSPFPAGTGIGVTIDPSNRFVYSTDTTPPGNVWAFTTDSTGALIAVPESPFAAGTNPSASANPSQIVVDSSGMFVFVTLTDTNQVAAFLINQSTGALTPVSGSPFSAGGGPIGMATLNNLLYVSNAGDGTVSGFIFDTTSGVLTPAAGSPFPISASALAGDPFGGNFLYASTAQGMVTYTIDPSSGALTQSGPPVSSPEASVLTFAH